jgi:hypothetical protein
VANRLWRKLEFGGGKNTSSPPTVIHLSVLVFSEGIIYSCQNFSTFFILVLVLASLYSLCLNLDSKESLAILAFACIHIVHTETFLS